MWSYIAELPFFSRLNCTPLYVYSMFACPWNLSCYHILTIMNSSAVNMGMLISLRNFVFSYFGLMSRSRISGSYNTSTFNFVKNPHTVFYSSCCTLHSHQQFTRVPISPYPYQHLSFIFVFFISFCNSHPDWCEVLSHGGFDWQFADD